MNIKTFSIHTVRNTLAFVIALGLGYTAYLVNPGSVEIPKAQATTLQNASGWIWSGGAGSGTADPGAGPYTAGSSTGVGWISLNDTNETAPYSGAAYGVNVDTTNIGTGGTGVFSGKAWSENVGWINFDSADVAGCPSGSCTAQVNWTSGIVTGWAHAYNGSVASGWDGWIKLGGDGLSWNGSACTGTSDNLNTNRCNYGVKIDPTTGNFSGYAWGGDVIGWVDFAPASAGINAGKISVPAGVCTLSNPNGFTWSPCDATASCVSGGGTTQYNLTGVQNGFCNDGSTGTVAQNCTAATTICTASGIWLLGDGICSSDLGETLVNSPTDCKPKTSWWQF